MKVRSVCRLCNLIIWAGFLTSLQIYAIQVTFASNDIILSFGVICTFQQECFNTDLTRLIRSRLIRSSTVIEHRSTLFWKLFCQITYISCLKSRLIQIPLDSKENFADEWLWINRVQPVLYIILGEVLLYDTEHVFCGSFVLINI